MNKWVFVFALGLFHVQFLVWFGFVFVRFPSGSGEEGDGVLCLQSRNRLENVVVQWLA